MPIPRYITRQQLREALTPLCELLATSPQNFFSIRIDAHEVMFVVPARHEDDPSGRARAARVERLSTEDLPPHPQGVDAEPVVVGDGEGAEWGYEVKVDIVDAAEGGA